MSHLSIEIKARSHNHDAIRDFLTQRNAKFIGTDHQIDTYFHVPNGRLKLREGTIENFLVHYIRGDQKGPKASQVTLYKSTPKSSLKKILMEALGVLVVVDKQREIFFLDNVKFHIDTVKDLGNFVEIEALDMDEDIARGTLQQQCEKYMSAFHITEDDLISCSYSDLLLDVNKASL